MVFHENPALGIRNRIVRRNGRVVNGCQGVPPFAVTRWPDLASCEDRMIGRPMKQHGCDTVKIHRVMIEGEPRFCFQAAQTPRQKWPDIQNRHTLLVMRQMRPAKGQA